jgi:hypothetical protein
MQVAAVVMAVLALGVTALMRPGIIFIVVAVLLLVAVMVVFAGHAYPSCTLVNGRRWTGSGDWVRCRLI